MSHRAAEQPSDGEVVPADLQVVFGKNLRDARVKAGLTQAEVAARTGLTPQYVGKIENGQKNVTLRTMQILALLLDHDVADLLRKVTGTSSSGSSSGKRVVRSSPST